MGRSIHCARDRGSNSRRRRCVRGLAQDARVTTHPHIFVLAENRVEMFCNVLIVFVG